MDTGEKIYVADTFHSRIVRVDNMTGANAVTFNTFNGTDSFLFPIGLFVETNGRIYVADFNNGRIVRVDDMTGANAVTLSTFNSGTDQFSSTWGVFLR